MAQTDSYACPSCGYEYEPWVEVCPDCNVPVVSTPVVEKGEPILSPDIDPEWTVVTNVPNAIIGNFIKGQLEDAGIPVLMFRSPSADIAQFSHNDFVPYDLRVPGHLMFKARQLIDSAPGNEFGAGPWSPVDEEYDPERSPFEMGFEEEDAPPSEPDDDLPEGWSLLPTESDVRARGQVMRTHGESLKGWYWTEDAPAQRAPYAHTDVEEDEEYPPQRYSRELDAGPYAGRSYESEGWYRPSKWVRIFYGIMLLAISLPFILQLLGQVWTAMTGQPFVP